VRRITNVNNIWPDALSLRACVFVCVEVEHVRRRELWEMNLMLITKHNLEASMGLHSYELGMNHMGDLVRPHSPGSLSRGESVMIFIGS